MYENISKRIVRLEDQHVEYQITADQRVVA